jgi:hypothetical protein
LFPTVKEEHWKYIQGAEVNIWAYERGRKI